MNSLHFLPVIIAIVLFNPVQSDVCDFDDGECLLKGATNFYKKMAAINDPLTYKKIKGQIKCFNYQITDITLSGLIKCEGIKSEVRNTSQSGVLCYDYDLYCPKLVLKFNYEAEGKLGSIEVDGKGKGCITLTKYVIKFNGNFVEFISDEDGEPHLTMKSNCIDTDPRGKLTLEVDTLSSDNDIVEDAVDYINSHWTELEKYLRCQIISKLIAKFDARQDRCLRTVPVDEIFSA